MKKYAMLSVAPICFMIVGKYNKREGEIVKATLGHRIERWLEKGGESFFKPDTPQSSTKGHGSMIPQNERSVEEFPHSWKLSPSDFNFLLGECPVCFWRKIVLGIERPRAPFPGLFNVIDRLMKVSYAEHGIRLPDGVRGKIAHRDLFIASETLSLPSGDCYLTGKLDSVLLLDDDTYAIIDFKASQPSVDNLIYYERQLMAYAYCLEHPALGKPAIGPITRLGLIAYSPDKFTNHKENRRAALEGGRSWIEVYRDDAAFFAFLDEVVQLLEPPDPPEPARSCSWCKYYGAATAA